nr:MAG TPA: hypothetical protein [Bacteriophage sp.]
MYAILNMFLIGTTSSFGKERCDWRCAVPYA